jgi:glycosyltransferase involved in cell wall biosynthesis
MRLLVIGPLPPLRSGVADYTLALLPHLRPLCEWLAVVVDGYMPELPPGLVDRVLEAGEEAALELEGARSVRLYHMGNQPRYHGYAFDLLKRYPGVTVLHDGNLLPFVHARTLEVGRRPDFVREAGFERGAPGWRAAWSALRGGGALDPREYPMLARVARSSLGVIVHSCMLLERVREVAPGVPVEVVPHLGLGWRGPDESKLHARAELGFAADDLIVGVFGFVAPERHLREALFAFARVRALFAQARFVCVGEPVPGYDWDEIVAAAGLNGQVRVTGYVPIERFERYVRAVDVAVNLRWPTWGEMSGALVRLMAAGVPTLVTDAGAFAELPDDGVIKITPDAHQVEAIAEALHRLLADGELRRAIGQQAKVYIAMHCDPARVARRYADFITRVSGESASECTCAGRTEALWEA